MTLADGQGPSGPQEPAPAQAAKGAVEARTPGRWLVLKGGLAPVTRFLIQICTFKSGAGFPYLGHTDLVL